MTTCENIIKNNILLFNLADNAHPDCVIIDASQFHTRVCDEDDETDNAMIENYNAPNERPKCVLP